MDAIYDGDNPGRYRRMQEGETIHASHPSANQHARIAARRWGGSYTHSQEGRWWVITCAKAATPSPQSLLFTNDGKVMLVGPHGAFDITAPVVPEEGDKDL